MFTGLVEERGVIEKIDSSLQGIRLVVRASRVGKGLKKGDSLAVNGCCLTVTSIRRKGRTALLSFDLLKETWERTAFSQLDSGSGVNLERSLQAASRLGGHFVTGHIDGVGLIRRIEPRGPDWSLEIEAPREVSPFLIAKGSIAVEGISLTVAQVRGSRFTIWIIPHTWQMTNLAERKPGDRVNLEADLLGKYVRKFVGR